MKAESDFSFNFKKITIIGVGLIGGSLGLALKEKKPDFKIIGIDKQEIIEKAIIRGAIDEGTINLKEGIKDKKKMEKEIIRGAIDKGKINLKKEIKEAVLVILATPVKLI